MACAVSYICVTKGVTKHWQNRRGHAESADLFTMRDLQSGLAKRGICALRYDAVLLQKVLLEICCTLLLIFVAGSLLNFCCALLLKFVAGSLLQKCGNCNRGTCSALLQQSACAAMLQQNAETLAYLSVRVL